jgi:hypothetical protein
MRHPSPLSLCLSLVWLPEGLRMSEGDSTATQWSAAGIPGGSKPIYFCNLGWIRDPEGVIVHNMCMSTTRCCTFGTKSLCRCCRTGVVESRSSQPWGRLHHLYRQCLCGSIIPAFGLRGYISESMLIITMLLLDRSWEIRGCIGNKSLLFAPNPNSGIRVWSMCSVLVRLEYIAICGRWSSHCYPPMCIRLYLWHSWIEAAQRPTLRLSRETGSTTDIRLALYKSAFLVSVSPTIVDMASAMEDP